MIQMMQGLSNAQWAILAIFGSLQNPDFIQMIGPQKSLFYFIFGTIFGNFQIFAQL